MMGKRVESVEILQKRFGYYPQRFLWRGRSFEVVQVLRVWCTERGWLRPAQWRRYALLTAEGNFELCHDLQRNLWSASRWPATCASQQAAPAPQARGRLYGDRLVMVR